MTIHVLVEGPSERAFIARWVGRLLKNVTVRVHPHQGKGHLPRNLAKTPDPKHRGLLDQLPAKLRAFAKSLSGDDSVLVLVDADDDNPEQLRLQLEHVTSATDNLRARVAIAIEETEAFYLADLRAVKAAFPGANMKMARTYEPDSICGTCELFGRVIGDGGNNKVHWAEQMGPRVTTSAASSRSPSFKRLIATLRALSRPGASPVKGKKRKYRHAPRGPRKRTGRR